MESTYRFTVNGETRKVTTQPERTLLEVLREDFELTGTKYGCGEGDCRACTILIDGRPKTACQIPMKETDGIEVATIESLATDDGLHPIQQAFIQESAMQCGYCNVGMIMTAKALLDTIPEPSREQIVEWMDGNICRCTNYLNILNAIERAAITNSGARVS
jgi:aerobic-type carbon monoxide dehydrogenase small subunit (CoxS/CutS family)